MSKVYKRFIKFAIIEELIIFSIGNPIKEKIAIQTIWKEPMYPGAAGKAWDKVIIKEIIKAENKDIFISSEYIIIVKINAWKKVIKNENKWKNIFL